MHTRAHAQLDASSSSRRHAHRCAPSRASTLRHVSISRQRVRACTSGSGGDASAASAHGMAFARHAPAVAAALPGVEGGGSVAPAAGRAPAPSRNTPRSPRCACLTLFKSRRAPTSVKSAPRRVGTARPARGAARDAARGVACAATSPHRREEEEAPVGERIGERIIVCTLQMECTIIVGALKPLLQFRLRQLRPR